MNSYDWVKKPEQLFPLFMSHLPGGAWVKDLSGRYVYANRYAREKIFLLPNGLLMGQTDHDLFPSDIAALYAGNDQLVMDTGQSLQAVETLPLGQEEHQSVVNKFPILDAHGKIAFVGGIAIDITARKRAEDALRNALQEVECLRQRLQSENLYLREEIRVEHGFGEIIGDSRTLKRALMRIDRVANTDVSVLITGETGTGKELVARAIHDRSLRRARALIKVSCGALSAGLVESELFGHEKGAFTGALQRRTGRFELADRGTIFLDEVGELAPETQVKLLHVLQDGEFEPVGSNDTRKVDVRVIAATNRNISDSVETGAFRADLFYRLNVLPIELPPLRERTSDIPLLVDHFLRRASAKFGRHLVGITASSMDRLIQYGWPGNVRELQNIIERAVVLSSGRMLQIDDATFGLSKPPAPPSDALADVERAHIVAILERTGWQIQGEFGAASILNMNPSTLRSRMKKLNIGKLRR